MQYYRYNESDNKICILVPEIRIADMEKHYLEKNPELDKNDILMLSLHQSGKKKTPVSEIKQYIEEELLSVFKDCGVKYLLCADSEYFKVLTKQSKAEPYLGYVLPCAYGDYYVAYIPNYRAVFYDPEKISKRIKQAVTAVITHMAGSYKAPGIEIIKFAEYPMTGDEIEAWLKKLREWDKPLTCDIEAFSLKHHLSGIGTISFCWSENEGIAFPVDLGPEPERVRALLKDFFIRFNQTITYHYIAFDVYALIYQLFMEHILDTEGLLEGLQVMLKNWDCTKIITFLATNSCAGNRLGLKEQAQEFSGNYAVEDIKDIRKIPLDELLQYNLVDGLSTWYVKNKNYPIMVADDQLEIYQTLFKPCMWDIIQMQLTGMPVNMKVAIEVNEKLAKEEALALEKILASPFVQHYTYRLEQKHIAKRNAKLKTKQIKIGDEPQSFNPNSDLQMRDLLFEFLKLPIINYTESKEASTDGETIEALMNRTEDPAIKELLEAIQMYTIVGTLTTNFMPAILNAVEGPDGWHYLFGNFNLGGTLSGRLSSSGPNLQNLPSTGKGHPKKLKFAKMIKSCFQAPPGWIFAGIDFASLEDRISALTTKDPNKLKVYTDGYDGHSLRAYAYFGDQMPDIDPNSVDSINSIQKKYKPLRDKSKNPTFTLTYQGTYIALVKKYGFSVEQAKDVEAKYHELYKVSDAWVFARLDKACETGYITGAFGLRLRTPLLKQVIRGTSKTPYEAEAEGRTAGNALGQSWCLLNSRAGMEFMGKVRESTYRTKIRPCAQIHDAQYFIVKDDILTMMFLNTHLVRAVKWQDHPEIAHDEVKLGGEVSIFYPSWAEETTIPNDATQTEIFEIIDAISH